MKNLVIILGVIAAAIVAYYLVGAYYLNTNNSNDDTTGGMSEEEKKDNSSASNSVTFQGTDADESDLINSSWSWQYRELQNGERINAPEGDKFVLSFAADGTMNSTTDCNNLGGVASMEGEVLSMGQFVSTLMYCEGSLEQEYVQHLSLVNSYSIVGDQLTLNMSRDYGVMVFNRYKE